MIILSLDTAIKTGWAICRDGRIIESGVQDFSKKRGESNGMMFLRFRVWLERMLEQKPDLVIYEQTFSRSQSATEILENLRGRIQEECASRDIQYTNVYASALKKWATGAGNADKGQMIARAVSYLGRPPIDDNEADAVMMAIYAWEEYGA